MLQTFKFADCPEFDSAGAAAAIHLHPSAELLGVSDRAAHSIGLFAVAESGELTFRQRIPCKGRTPRDFMFTPDGCWLVAACQDTHGLASYAVAEDLTVSPVPAGRLEVNSPVCVSIYMERSAE